MREMTKEDWNRLRSAQNGNTHIDIMTIVAFMKTRAEVLKHIARYES